MSVRFDTYLANLSRQDDGSIIQTLDAYRGDVPYAGRVALQSYLDERAATPGGTQYLRVRGAVLALLRRSEPSPALYIPGRPAVGLCSDAFCAHCLAVEGMAVADVFGARWKASRVRVLDDGSPDPVALARYTPPAGSGWTPQLGDVKVDRWGNPWFTVNYRARQNSCKGCRSVPRSARNS